MQRHQPTEEEGKQSLVGHAAQKAWEARQVYGEGAPGLSMPNLEVLLQDRKFIRYPVRISFDASPLQDDEASFPHPIEEDSPKAGFVMFVHPSLQGNDEAVAMVVTYQLVAINYGDIAEHEAAEHFGSILMGMDVETYYRKMCAITDGLAA
jgi:hypothetical protein